MFWILLLACNGGNGADTDGACDLVAPDPGTLSVEGTLIVDQHGRRILLRGVNAGGRSKFAPYMPFDWDGSGSSSNDFDQALAEYLDRAESWGLDVLRVPFSWAAEEPVEGQPDEAWAQRYDALLDGAWERGMWTIVDFHQDIYSEAWCGDGFPLWTLADFDPDDPPDVSHDCPDWFLGYLGNDDVDQAFDRFWADEDGIQTAWRAMWQRMATRHRDRPGVIGYEIINEPGEGSFDNDEFFGQVLPTMYSEVAAELQVTDPDALVFFDSTGLDAVQASTALAQPDGANLIFAPHFYDPSIFLGGEGDPDFIAEGLTDWHEQGQEWDLPVLIGEFGIQPDRDSASESTRAHYDTLDALSLHATWWEYSQSVEDWNEEGLSVVAADGSEHDVVLDELVRPYPRAMAGQPGTWVWDGESGRLDATWQADAQGITEIRLPGRRFGEDLQITAEGACFDRQDDVLLVQSTEGGEVHLTLTEL